MPGKPNILIIMADEFQASALSCMGHDVVRTPHIDGLAARGTSFLNAYTPSPICVPARAALATGRYVHRCGYWDNALAYDGALPSWGHRLQKAGIGVSSIGKLHYRSEEDPTGFDEQILPMHIMDGIGQVWGSIRNPLPRKPRPPGMLGRIGAGLSSYNRYDLDVAEASQHWIERRAGDGRPWAAFVSFVAPHFPLTVPKEYLADYPAPEMPLPALHPDRGYRLHPWVARKNLMEDTDAELGSDDARREAIAAYYALCAFVDAQIGRVLDALARSGQSDRTLVILTSDHGEQLGMRGQWGKDLLYRESTQVPLILAGSGVPAGKQRLTPVSLLDIPPTVTQALGLAPDPDWVGLSLLEFADSPDDAARLVFSEYHAVGSPSGGFMIADARWKYHHYVGYAPELFDLQDDPLEECNLAEDPSHADQLARLSAALRSICDPQAVDAAAKRDQDALVARFGGVEQAWRAGPKGATPAPDI